MAIIDKIQLSGTVYTIGNETTTAVTSASTDNEIPTAKAVYDAIPQGGGGKAISGGTNISITTGETADTINCTLPITTAIDNTSLNFGLNRINSEFSYSFGNNNTVGSYRYTSNYSMAVGSNNIADGGEAQFVTGYSNKLLNVNEFGSGRFNNSVLASDTFGDSGNTLFSVGNGTSINERHNAFEIRQNGDIYITKDGQDVKLQDQLGGGSGGKSIEAGRGISITTGETAYTVSFNLPISAGTGTNALIYNSTTNSANGSSSHAEGYSTTASGYYAHAEGYIANAKGYASHAEGLSTKSKGFGSHAEGRETEANGYYSHSEGYLTRTTNESEHSSGRYNNSVSASTTWGDSGNTLFSVGNGTDNNARHNAFEIRQNGDIYITKDGQDVKLQDQLGGGGSSYTAGDGIDITNDVISVTGKVDTSAITTTITSSSTDAQVPSAKSVYDQLGGLKLVKLSQSEYDSLETKNNSTLYVIVN